MKPGLIRMPVDWRTLFGDLSGIVEFVRHFHWPTNLEPGEQAWLVFDGIGGTAVVNLNGERLGTASGTGRFDVTHRLQSGNRLCVELTCEPERHDPDGRRGGLFGTVALELIEPPASTATSG